MHYVLKHVRHGVVIYLFLVSHSVCFWAINAAGAVTALTFRTLKQTTIKESLGVGKTR